jgi:hypothetical protein
MEVRVGIAEDFYGLKNQWSKLSFLTRIVFVFSFALSLLSVGSLADSAFNFKGFIIYGIEFYNAVTEPIKVLLSNIFQIEIDRIVFDFFLLLLIWVRVSFLEDENIDERGGWVVYFLALIAVGVFSFIFGLIFRPLLGYLLTGMILLPILAILYETFINKELRITKLGLLKAGYFFLIYFFVACIAAISEGLSRPNVG